MHCKVGVGYSSMKRKIDANDALANISRRKIGRHLKRTDWGESRIKNVNNKPLLSMVNVQARQQFHSHLTQNDYLLSEEDDTEFFSRRLRENVLYTDESHIDLYPNNNSHNAVWRGPLNEKPVYPRVNYSPKLMVAGGNNAHGKTPLIIVPPGQTVSGEYYREVILPVYFNYLLLQDSVHKEPRPANLDELEIRLQDTWNSISFTHLNNLSNSLLKRVKELENNNFYSINY